MSEQTGDDHEGLRDARPGDLIPASRSADPILEDGDDTGIPEQEDFYRSPVRFGSIPVEQAPLGWDRRQKFNKLYPFVSLPTQVVERVSFGSPQLEPNRLFWGDNLHVMRQLPSESIDLIYIDPPFFSGAEYNVIFGDRNEARSFSDIWDSGMPGYLEWLNARLFEMKRLLRPGGSLVVHLDWHAVHYVKVELDKIFGYRAMQNEIIWFHPGGGASTLRFGRKHDTLLWYSRSSKGYKFNLDDVRVEYRTANVRPQTYSYENNKKKRPAFKTGFTWTPNEKGKVTPDVWDDIKALYGPSAEIIGYPTQKPEALLTRVVLALSSPGDVVGDFYVGGGTTAAVAQASGRRWIACDQSRVAVAVTADRVAKQGEQLALGTSTENTGVPDFTLEHWGTYEAARLSQAPPDQFRRFVIDAAQLRAEPAGTPIHAFKSQLPVWIGPPDRNHRVTPQEVVDFANAVRRLETFRQGSLREARMIAWAFSPAAQQQANAISLEKENSQNYLDIDLVQIESDSFREHIIRLSSDKADYSTFLTFVRPPEIVVGKRQLGGREWRFDVSDTLVTNSSAKLINVQWDFDYREKRFTSSLGYKDLRNGDGSPKLVVDWRFPRDGTYHIACKVQDDMGGEGFWTETMTVSS